MVDVSSFNNELTVVNNTYSKRIFEELNAAKLPSYNEASKMKKSETLPDYTEIVVKKNWKILLSFKINEIKFSKNKIF